MLLTTLACGATVEAAAQKAGMSERSVYRRLESPDFKQQLQDFRSDILKRTSAMLTAASMEGVKTLLSLMSSSTAPATRLGAAKAVIELSIRLREIVELEERIKSLEKQVRHYDNET